MIVGGGLIASAFKDSPLTDDFVIFASGVSSSKSNHAKSFEREKDLLERYLSLGRVLVYFSSVALSSTASRTPYYHHKQNMEQMVLRKEGIVVRLPQVVGHGGNPANLFNHLLQGLKKGGVVVFQNAKRELIDVEDVEKILAEAHAQNLLNKGRVYIVSSGLPISVSDLCQIIATELSVDYSIRYIDGGDEQLTGAHCLGRICDLVVGNDSASYYTRLIKKYVY